MVTLEDYKKAVLTRYEEVKNGEFSEFLSLPTPAKFKKLCLLLLDGLNATDKNIFNIFFKAENTTRKCIEVFDNDKFRPLRNFVIGKSNLSRQESIDLIAVFIKLDSRPYSKFRIIGEVTSEEAENELQTPQETEEHISEKNIVTVLQSENKSSFKEPSVREEKRHLLIALKPNQLQLGLLTLIIITLITIFTNEFEEEGCMRWTKDHYERVDCDTKKILSAYSTSRVIAYDEKEYNYLKKVTVCDTTTFFNPDKTPRIWYYKSSNGKLEFFTYRGEHPEVSGKELNPITDYIIKKWIKNKRP